MVMRLAGTDSETGKLPQGVIETAKIQGRIAHGEIKTAVDTDGHLTLTYRRRRSWPRP